VLAILVLCINYTIDIVFLLFSPLSLFKASAAPIKLYFLKSSNAEKYGKTPAQIILKWHNQMGFIVIPGSRNPEHIKENADRLVILA
jgi:diketogulonate reductase-like aldo/keto reductase